MKNGKVGWAFEFSKRLGHRERRFLLNSLKISNVLKPSSLLIPLKGFIKGAGYKNMVIWLEANCTYVLVIDPDRIELRRNYEEKILKFSRIGEEIFIKEKNGEGLRALEKILEEILEIKKGERLA